MIRDDRDLRQALAESRGIHDLLSWTDVRLAHSSTQRLPGPVVADTIRMWNNIRTDASGSDLKILIVEDEFFARNALATLLAGFGYSPRAFESAESALERIDQDEHLEVALVDLDLPGMNGAEFISRLTTQQPWVFAVLITAASPDRVSRVLAKGVPHLRKPLDFQELLKVLDTRSRSH